MSKKIQFVLLAILLALVVGCSKNNKEEAQGKESAGDSPSAVKIGYQVIPNAELLAKHQGALEKKFPDTKIQWVEFDSGRDVNTAMATGDIDFGLVGSVPLATGIANKLPYQVYYIHDVIGEAESLVVQKSSGIKNIKDLAGKKVAVPFGSTAHFSLLMALKQEGLKPNQLTILDMQPQDILAAWHRKDLDAAFVWNPTLGKILSENGTILTSAQKLAENGIITSDVGVVQKKFAKQYPEFIKEYVKILDENVKTYEENPKEIVKQLASALAMSEEETATQIKGLVWLEYEEQKQEKYLGTADSPGNFAKVLSDTGAFLKNQKIINSNPNIDAYESSILYLK